MFLKFEYILVYRPSYIHNRKIFIAAWITYIYVWQRCSTFPDDERSISRTLPNVNIPDPSHDKNLPIMFLKVYN